MTLEPCYTDGYLISLLYVAVFYITIVYLINFVILLYGIGKNLTHEEMYDSYKCKYLWKQIHYITERKILIRKFQNAIDRGWK